MSTNEISLRYTAKWRGVLPRWSWALISAPKSTNYNVKKLEIIKVKKR